MIRRCPKRPLGTMALLAGAALVLLAGCASDDEPAYVETPVETLYGEAMDALEERDFVVAAEGFDEVDRQHPYSTWSTRAQMMAAFSYYQANLYDDAIIAARRFIELHPGHRDVAYVYYLVAMCHYEQITSVEWDQTSTSTALAALEEVVRRFPETSYARDASLKIDLAMDHLAGKEMSVGRFYLQRRQYIAAIQRFRRVVEDYQTTSHVPEALHRLTEAYLAIGVTAEAQAAAEVLGYNYPGSEWYEHSYALLVGANAEPAEGVPPPGEDESSWIGRTFDALF